MSKKIIKENLFDLAVKGVVGLFFGKKFIDRAARSAALRDPEVKKKMKDVKDAIADFDAIMAKYQKK